MKNLVLGLVGLLAAASCQSSEGPEHCPLGAFGNASETVYLYVQEVDSIQNPRYLFVDGRRGHLQDPDSPVKCVEGVYTSLVSGHLKEIALRQTDRVFKGSETLLAGRLVEPILRDGARSPLAVFVHGSERTPTVGYSPYPYILAAQGVSVFAYDKRGTGSSGGTYTQDFHLLAQDAVAAADTARQIATGRFDRIGFFGGSQGGWVAPLAATESDVEFLVVGFGLVLSPLEEDAEQVFDELRRAGYSEEIVSQARKVTDATGEVVASKFSAKSIDELELVKEEFKDASWLNEIEGEFTGTILRAPRDVLATGHAPGFEDLDVPWRHDPVAVMRQLKLSQLWVIAEKDRVAPGRVTRDRLAMLQSEGLPITTAVFPDTDHGMLEFVEHIDGTRTYTRFTDGFFRLMADYMKVDVSPPYGSSVIVDQKD